MATWWRPVGSGKGMDLAPANLDAANLTGDCDVASAGPDGRQPFDRMARGGAPCEWSDRRLVGIPSSVWIHKTEGRLTPLISGRGHGGLVARPLLA